MGKKNDEGTTLKKLEVKKGEVVSVTTNKNFGDR
jgi:hypothetical protein